MVDYEKKLLLDYWAGPGHPNLPYRVVEVCIIKNKTTRLISLRCSTACLGMKIPIISLVRALGLCLKAVVPLNLLLLGAPPSFAGSVTWVQLVT